MSSQYPSEPRVKPNEPEPKRLKEALRKARVDSAERMGVVVDLYDAEVARLELLNDALDPIFAEVPADADLFDRGITRGETPRLWFDSVAHVVMARDKRIYRFVQDTRYGRKVLTESVSIPAIVDAVTTYLAQRLIERERALVDSTSAWSGARLAAQDDRRRRIIHLAGAFVAGLCVGVVILTLAAMWAARL